MTQPGVVQAFHANHSFGALAGMLNFHQNSGPIGPIYKKIFALAPKLNILLYSGLEDLLQVPFSYTMPCIYQLMGQQPIKNKWTSWHLNHHRGGHWMQWETNRFTYATVRGAGHQASQFQPVLVAELIKRFLSNGDIADPQAE